MSTSILIIHHVTLFCFAVGSASSYIGLVFCARKCFNGHDQHTYDLRPMENRLPAVLCSCWVYLAALLGVATAASVHMAKEKPAVVWPLMAPYLCWVTFATALTGEILRLNPDVSGAVWALGLGDKFGGFGLYGVLRGFGVLGF